MCIKSLSELICEKILVLGPVGSGKTSAVIDMLNKEKRGYITYSCHEGMKSYAFIKMLYEAYNTGKVIVLDDIDYAPIEIISHLLNFIQDNLISPTPRVITIGTHIPNPNLLFLNNTYVISLSPLK